MESHWICFLTKFTHPQQRNKTKKKLEVCVQPFANLKRYLPFKRIVKLRLRTNKPTNKQKTKPKMKKEQKKREQTSKQTAPKKMILSLTTSKQSGIPILGFRVGDHKRTTVQDLSHALCIFVYK
jgi:hypothetical protein